MTEPASGGVSGRLEEVEPFVRGAAWPAGAGATYPRADPADFARLPIDTWGAAQLPVGVRLELVGDAHAIDVAYRTETDDFGYRGKAAGDTFAVYRGGEQVDEQDAVLGEGIVRLSLDGPSDERVIVYLPEAMKPSVLSIRPIDGGAEPAPAEPTWVCYGDSIAEGWVASAPAAAWTALAGRRFGLDVRNLGYAGSARGEIVSAEHIASVPADVISISHGTNCWTRVPFSAGMMREGTAAFLAIVRQGHPTTPIVVASPVVRPDAEDQRNRLDATLADLRAAVEDAVQKRIAAGDDHLTLIPGANLLTEQHLADGIHPGDEGHRIMADVIGAEVARVLQRRERND